MNIITTTTAAAAATTVLIENESDLAGGSAELAIASMALDL